MRPLEHYRRAEELVQQVDEGLHGEYGVERSAAHQRGALLLQLADAHLRLATAGVPDTWRSGGRGW